MQDCNSQFISQIGIATVTVNLQPFDSHFRFGGHSAPGLGGQRARSAACAVPDVSGMVMNVGFPNPPRECGAITSSGA
jgi:hypothetical protein